MLASACSAEPGGRVDGHARRPDPASHLLSVPSDTVYMVDPDSGAVAVVVNDLTDFQAGCLVGPNRTRYAYGQAGIDVTRHGSNNVVPVVRAS
jgi:hypothetical protein